MQVVGALAIGVVDLVAPPCILQQIQKAFTVAVGQIAVTERLPLQLRAVEDAPPVLLVDLGDPASSLDLGAQPLRRGQVQACWETQEPTAATATAPAFAAAGRQTL